MSVMQTDYTPTTMSSTDTEESLRLICLGKTGHGKSTLCNSILGREVFQTSNKNLACTSLCAVGKGSFRGISFTVVDTPGLYGNQISQLACHTGITKCIQAVDPGPHAFLITVRLDARFTTEERSTLDWIKNKFGPRALDYCIVVFTHEEWLMEGETLTDYLSGGDSALREFVEVCGGGFCAINNRAQKADKELRISKLIGKINEMIIKNGGKRYYSNEMFEGVSRVLRRAREAHGEYAMLVNPDGTIRVYPEAINFVNDTLCASSQ